MTKINYSISFLTYWHAGSGLTSGTQADSIVIKDENGLPIFPGKTLKGVFRDAFKSLKDSNLLGEMDEIRLFGQENNPGNNELKEGSLFFSNAELPERESLAKSKNLIPALYDTLASTEINQVSGVAEKGSLRVIEICVPLNLSGTISGFKSGDEAEEFTKVFAFTKALGGHRNRGLGRCVIQKTAIQ